MQPFHSGAMAFRGSPQAGARFAASKHATPELALLEGAAHELANLDEFELLPAAVVDMVEAVTPTTAAPTSPDGETSEDECEAAPQGAHGWSQEPPDFQPGGDVPGAVPAASAFQPAAPAEMAFEPQGGYMAMWCWMQHMEDGRMTISPFAPASMEDVEEEPPECPIAGGCGTCIKMWCWVQPNGAGSMMVVPCTDRLPSGAAQQPETPAAAAEEEWAPPPPPPGSYVPAWVPGPYWPFNISPTTLSLSNLPDDLTQDELLEILDREEFSGLYDFVFLPAACAGSGSAPAQGPRCALVNLIKHQHALSLAARLHGKTAWGGGDRRRACEVTWSLPIQGLEELVQTFRDAPENSPDVEESLRPQLFERGWPTPLPPPRTVWSGYCQPSE